jgi:signal transduction histidine kinase/ActR/RegA family two-component response regulator
MRNRSGETLWIEKIHNVYSAGHQRVLQANMRDVSERQRLEEELRQAQKMDSIGRLAGGLSHDFNNILNIISAYSGILERGDETKRTQSLEAINKAVQRGAAVVRQLLTFARRDGVSFEPVDVNEILGECGNIVRETFPKKIELALELAPDLPRIQADPNQLHQAFLNLCVNARDAMPSGGKLTIESGVAARDEIRERFPESTEATYLHVRFADTGVGMDGRTRTRLFEPFFTTKVAGKGSGLGLPVVYGIVQGHQGLIAVDSRPGEGASFDIYLPVRDRLPEKETSRETAKTAGERNGTEKILLVEDEAMLRDSVQSLLESEGYSVVTAADGVEAVDLYRRRGAEINVVVFDQELPRLSGWDALRQIRDVNPNVSAIVASGHLDRTKESEVRAWGARAVVRKPYTAERILTAIREVLEADRATAASLPPGPRN